MIPKASQLPADAGPLPFGLSDFRDGPRDTEVPRISKSVGPGQIHGVVPGCAGLRSTGLQRGGLKITV